LEFVVFFEVLGPKLVVITEHLLVHLRVQVRNALPEVSLVFKNPVEAQQLVHLELLLQQLFLVRLDVRLKHGFFAAFRVNHRDYGARLRE
jgi:hypothetical protein